MAAEDTLDRDATAAPPSGRRTSEARRREDMPRPGQKMATFVYQRLRDEILSLTLEPGAAVSEKEMALACGVSRTPVREALLRLADEGLVEIIPKSGTVVTRIPASRLLEAIIVRTALEEVTVRAAARKASLSDLMGLRMLLQRQLEAAEAGDESAFHVADDAFHAAIAEAAGYPGIWKLVQQVKLQVDRYRRLTLPQEGRMARVHRDHSAIVAALEARDGDAAANAMAAHLDTLQASLEDIRKAYPGYFDEEDGRTRSVR